MAEVMPRLKNDGAAAARSPQALNAASLMLPFMYRA